MKKKVAAIIDILKDRYPQALCALHYKTDYQLMIAVRLSAQCTDARVNLVTPALFEAYPTLDDLANASISDIETYIHSCGFYRQKAKDIVLSCQMLINDYNRKVPDSMEELLKLPGVGRKTANEPEKVEKQLRAILPPEESSDFCHRIVLFGRDCCTARNPKCGECPLAMYCTEINASN